MGKAIRHQRKFLRRIARTAALPSSPERYALLQRERLRYVRSGGVKAAHLRTMKRHRHKSDAAIARLADRIDLLTPCTQPVPWWPKRKDSDGIRPICNPPTKARLGQLVAKGLIGAQIQPDPCLYDWPARGIHRCIRDIGNALQSTGPHACIVDIKDCYQHVEIDNLYQMDLLPPELIRSSIDVRHLSFRRSHRHSVDEYMVAGMCSAGPEGLMQGGPASAAIVVALLGDVSRSIRAPSWMAAYADDFIVAGADRGVVVRAGEDLTRYITECPLGPSECKPPRIVDVRGGFHFLGCLFWQMFEGIDTCIPADRFDSIIDKMVSIILNPARGEERRTVNHHVRKALGPYPWAPDWQRELVTEAAEMAYAQRSRSCATLR